ncbi:MAG: NAD(P)/FAD-dependent oxidoreductase [Erysipelothrix sp.]|nr:NAD(P)/FAD-dependent oxidoreductase [Erysipelothrix sp.]
MKDVVIIGGGIVGAAVARELSRYQTSILVIERADDICEGATKANSAIIHSGLDAKPGTLKAHYNVRGNIMYDQVEKELGIKLMRNGSLNLMFDEGDNIDSLLELKAKGEENGVEGLEIVDQKWLNEHEPNLQPNIKWALYAPTAGLVDSFEVNIAYAENASDNGVKFQFNTEVKNIKAIDGGYLLETNEGDIKAKVVINCAGIHSDEMNNYVSNNKIEITARRGEYYLLDKDVHGFVNHTLFQQPTVLGKGVLIAPTVSDNVIVGPNAHEVIKDDTTTTIDGMKEVAKKAKLSVKDLPLYATITTFSGLRATGNTGDFIIGEVEDAPGFFNCAAVESPGLTSAPAIAVDIATSVAAYLNLEDNKDFNPIRKRPLILMELSDEERHELIKKEPAYGNIVCRCEMISEGEVLRAIKHPVGARSLDGIKRRTRAGSGRCQAGFCSPKQIELLVQETGMTPYEVTKFGKGSNIIVEPNKSGFKEENHGNN